MRRNKVKCKFGESKADIRIIARGKDLGEAVENSFSCFYSYVFNTERTESLNNVERIQFRVENGETEDVIHDIYSEIIYLIYVREYVIRDIFVRFDEGVEVVLDMIKPRRFVDYVRGEIKAITYHNLKVTEDKNEVVLDMTFDV